MNNAIIHSLWETYIHAHQEGIPKDEVNRTRRAFYAGIVGVLATVSRASSEQEAEIVMSSIEEELINFTMQIHNPVH